MAKEQTQLEELLEYVEDMRTRGSYAFEAGYDAAKDEILNKIQAVRAKGITCKPPTPEREDPTLDDPTSVEGNENLNEQ